jgi:hypothetical protein
VDSTEAKQQKKIEKKVFHDDSEMQIACLQLLSLVSMDCCSLRQVAVLQCTVVFRR